MTTPILSLFRKKQSKKTGLLHFSFSDPTCHDAAPIYENLLFTLALFQSKTLKDVMEGKNLFKRMLSFMTKQGAFPEYIHTYPYPARSNKLLEITLILFFLSKDFSHFLLDFSLKKMIKKLLHFQRKKWNAFSDVQRLKYLILAETNVLHCYEKLGDLSALDSSSILLFAQILKNDVREKIFSDFSKYYDPFRNVYFGPPIQEKFNGKDPQHVFFPFFFQKSLDLASDTSLYLPLIQKKHLFEPVQKQSESTHWINYCDEKFSFSCLKNNVINTSTFFRLFWKEESELFSFVGEDCPCFEKNCFEKRKMTTFFVLSDELEENDFEAKFYVLRSEKLQILVEGKKANTFRLTDTISIENGTKKIFLRFFLEKGKGDFLGHIFYANRISQTIKDPFQLFDWMIGLRTIRKDSTCRIRTEITLF